MEKQILALEAENAISPEDEDEQTLEDRALDRAIEEIYETNGKKWKPWAKNGRSLRVGDIILIVDSDTIVPEVESPLFAVDWYSFLLPRIVSEMLLEKWQNVLK